MWNPYQYHKGKLKLVKDLKNAPLRHSLIDIDQFQNIGKIFKERKEYYHFDELQPVDTAPIQSAQEDTVAAPAFMTPEQRIALYRKQMQSNKMKEKFNSMFKKKESRKYNYRKPVLHKMLTQFQEKYGRQKKNEQLKRQLKQSERRLQHTKIKAGREEARKEEGVKLGRQKFISLQTSLPQKQKYHYPTFNAYIQQKYSNRVVQSSGINMALFQTSLNMFITSAPAVPKRTRKLSRDCSSPEPQKNNAESPQKRERQERKSVNQPARYNQKSRPSANRTFTRSEYYSNQLIGTMSNFYQTKRSKSRKSQNMIEFIRHDRPLTSDLRRRNYPIVKVKHMSEIQVYRGQAEAERQQMLQRNHSFYYSLLHFCQQCREEDIPTTLKILQGLRQMLQSDYFATKNDVRKMLQKYKNQKTDPLTQEMVSKIANFIGDQSLQLIRK